MKVSTLTIWKGKSINASDLLGPTFAGCRDIECPSPSPGIGYVG